MAFWRITHAPKYFSADDRKFFLDSKLILGGSDNYNRDKFKQIRAGDYFYLTHGNTEDDGEGIQLFGKVVGELELCTSGKWSGWLQYHYEPIKPTVHANKFYGAAKSWTPYYSTNTQIYSVPVADEQDFEDFILRPYSTWRLIRRRMSRLTLTPISRRVSSRLPRRLSRRFTR